MPARDLKHARELVRDHFAYFAGLWEQYIG
jgi:hypothetical protein